MLIDGKFIKAKKQVPVKNPYTGEVIEMVCSGTVQDLQKAVDAAKRSTITARNMTPYQRYEILFSVYEQMKNRKAALARLITSENGKTIRESKIEVDRSLQTILFSAEEAKRVNGEFLSADVTPLVTVKKAFTFREPIGVIGAITPFNYPLNLVAHKMGPAIASGNTMVLKPASQTPLSSYEFARMFIEAGIPNGMLNVVSGTASEIGDALVQSDIDMISFTGSVEVGKRIASKAGMKKLSLELGGNGPLIVMDDADIEKAVDAAVDGAFGTAGQRCTAVKRILLHDPIAEEFISQFVKATEKLKVGDPLDESTDIGPLISEEAAVDIERRVKDAVENGARLLLGGRRKDALFWPTILDEVPRDVLMVRKETFGPVAPIIRFNSLKEAIKIANETEYGLQAGIFTNNLTTIKYAMKNIETGTVIINGSPGFRIESLPFGGVKNSGIGREGVKYAIQEMTEIKTVIF
jgi:lactaldehyde dehydrogenase